MTLRLRDALADDLATVAALNEEAGQAVAPLGAADLLWRYQRAPYFRIAEVDGVLFLRSRVDLVGEALGPGMQLALWGVRWRS